MRTEDVEVRPSILGFAGEGVNESISLDTRNPGPRLSIEHLERR